MREGGASFGILCKFQYFGKDFETESKGGWVASLELPWSWSLSSTKSTYSRCVIKEERNWCSLFFFMNTMGLASLSLEAIGLATPLLLFSQVFSKCVTVNELAEVT